MATYDFSGQVAFVTGAGTGIGVAAAEAFAEAGAAVAMVDVDGNVVEQAAGQLSDKGHHVLPLQCDVSVDGDVAAAVKQSRGSVASTWRSTMRES